MSSRIEQLIDEIEEYIDGCKYQPLSNTKIIVVKDVKKYEAKLYELLQNKYSKFLQSVESGNWDDEDVSTLKSALAEMSR